MMKYKVNYNDNTFFEFDEDSSESNNYQKINRTKLLSVELFKNKKLIHKLNLDKNKRLILRRRVKQNFIGQQKIIYLVGYQETIRGENRQAITIIHEDGHTELISKWNDEYYSPVLLEMEK